jgi:hypothetical protein
MKMIRNARLCYSLLLLLLSCQGPWDYYPENPENYQGIWVNAYIISGRPVQNVCFDKMHALDEVRVPGFAFYESAEVRVKGVFCGADTSFPLFRSYDNPNCFIGPENLTAEAGQNYELDVSITWDSAGKKVSSNFHAETYIPKKFKILKAYDLLGQPYSSGDTILFLPPPMDMKSNYFIPDPGYSDDIGGVRVTMILSENIYWGQSSIDEIIEQFTGEIDTSDFALFGDRRSMYTARNQQVAGSKKDMDSIPIIGMRLPAIGTVKLLFYATTPDYIKYLDTYVNGSDDSRIKAVYNIRGGAGIFAGMLVDTFVVNLDSAQGVKVFQNEYAQDYFCRVIDPEIDVPHWKLKRECVEVWDQRIWNEIHCESDTTCDAPPRPPWYEIPREDLERVLSKEEQITWCEHRDFPIYMQLDRPQLCGSALVRYSKTGKKSAILDREVKKWCETYPDDTECASL